MSNKRDLKRSLNYACSELFAECLAASLNVSPDEQSHINDILTSILKTHSDFVRRVSHPEPGMKSKYYYKVLIDDFNKYVEEIIDSIQALG